VDERPDSRYLTLRIESGSPGAFDLGLQDFAVRCLEQHYSGALIRIADDDVIGERLLRNALTIVMLAGVPADFRLALLAANGSAAARYRDTERELTGKGMNVRLFTADAEALAWLGTRL
jgi:hypothetical protein